jgi:hypothetical protein
VAVSLSIALHAVVLALASKSHFAITTRPEAPKPTGPILLELIQAAPAHDSPRLASPPVHANGARRAKPAIRIPEPLADGAAPKARQPAFMEAPRPPTAEEWALAAKYTLKNSKRYRYTWGQQVRSMMGTAVEGPDQGLVRFRIEIAPDGRLARLETVWTTSSVAERLARKAIENLPPLPPTPTGKALIFERTISFEPFGSDAPPVYANDCLPDPPAYGDPFAWDGKSPQVQVAPPPVKNPDPKELEECLKQLPQDSLEAESAHDQRQLDQWESPRLGR